jgi:hypothetical protein
MIDSIQAKAAMRHIPEEELHAYLDQGLSRSQCVEIESHLAICPYCQASRDGIAALRDRTTALLAKLAPPRGFPPSFESLRRRASVEASARHRRLHQAAWAASLVAAIGLGWSANYVLTPQPRTPVVATSPAAVPAVPTPSVTPTILRPEPKPRVAAEPPTRRPRRQQRPVAAPAESLPVVPAPTLELSSIDIPRTDLDVELDGVWRTMSWDGAQAEAGDKLPHIDGLPVVQVQLQASQQGKQPLMVVAQQLASGEVIRTIEGPTSDVSQLLARRTMTDPDPSASGAGDWIRSKRPAGQTDHTMAMQRGDRMLVITGALPSDSLLAMIRRLNAEMRSK